MFEKFWARRLQKTMHKVHHLEHLFHDKHHNHPHIHKFYDSDKPLISLSNAQKGDYEFITTLCDHETEHRLLEMGFIPQTIIKVIDNPDAHGAVLIEIKGSQIALNYKIANDIYITKKQETK
jgi:Fe2+ transport system protein FeoA